MNTSSSHKLQFYQIDNYNFITDCKFISILTMKASIASHILFTAALLSIVHIGSAAPPKECKDSPLTFRYKQQPYNCAWVAESKDERCAIEINYKNGGKGFVASHCQSTCGVCDPSIDVDSTVHFEVATWVGNDEGIPQFVNKFKRCVWVTKKNGCNKCKKLGVKETCPASCNAIENCDLNGDKKKEVKVKEAKVNEAKVNGNRRRF